MKADQETSTIRSECRGKQAQPWQSATQYSPGFPCRVFDTVYTPTADFVLSASDDGNVRIWKNNASAKLGPMDTRERQQMEYRKKLREKWSGEASVRKIERYVSLLGLGWIQDADAVSTV
jgi:hypothetical protein